MSGKMKYSGIPGVKKPVSRIFYGAGGSRFWQGENMDELLDAVFALGVTAFDTARVYGASEEVLGNWLERRNLREQVVLLSKCGHPDLKDGTRRVNEEDIRRDFELSSRYLKTDYIDIYLLHRDDPQVEVGVLVELLNAMHAEGKIGAFGGSNWTCERIEEANEYAYRKNLIPFTVSSPNYGLARQAKEKIGDCVSLSGLEDKAEKVWYEKNQLPLIAYSALGSGFFSGKITSSHIEAAPGIMGELLWSVYGSPDNLERLRRCEKMAGEKGCSVSTLALAWIFAGKLNTFAVMSTNSARRMEENIEALYLPLTEAERRYLNLEE